MMDSEKFIDAIDDIYDSAEEQPDVFIKIGDYFTHVKDVFMNEEGDIIIEAVNE